MKHILNASNLIALSLSLSWAGHAFSQSAMVQVPDNVVQLSASSAIEVAQDFMVLSMSTTREGAEPSSVQAQLKAALDLALSEAKKFAKPGAMEVRTGAFSLSPRYNRDGKITGWVGSSELVIEGRDLTLIGATAGKIQSLVVSAVQMSLSREQRALAESQAQSLAIEKYKSRAGEIARGFGFSSFSLREVSVQAGDSGFVPRPRAMALEARAAMVENPLPLEAGKTTVQVTVSGSVQLK